MDDGGGSYKWTTGAISRAKLQSNRHHQQTNIQFFYRPDALPVAQPTVSKPWRETFINLWLRPGQSGHDTGQIIIVHPKCKVRSILSLELTIKYMYISTSTILGSINEHRLGDVFKYICNYQDHHTASIQPSRLGTNHTLYEGRSINKLQISVILLVFQI